MSACFSISTLRPWSSNGSSSDSGFVSYFRLSGFRDSDHEETMNDIARRAFLRTAGFGLGSIALASLLERRGLAEPAAPFKLGKATARRVILIIAAGGLSQHDLFDEKPLLNKRRGEELPDSVRKGQRITGVTE